MKCLVTFLIFLLLSFSPAFSQQRIDGASREDVEQLLQLTGSRARIQQMWDAMIQQAAAMAVESYKRKNPNASPMEVRTAAQAAGESLQKTMKVLSVDELIEAIVPIYQRHLTHSDIKAIVEFYSSPTGEKLLKETPAMMAESLQAVQPILQKHLPELEAQAVEATKEAEPASK